MNFTFFLRPDTMDCGTTCLRMLAKHCGRNISLQTLREKTQIDKEWGKSFRYQSKRESELEVLKAKVYYENEFIPV